jgi:hypothetical protein
MEKCTNKTINEAIDRLSLLNKSKFQRIKPCKKRIKDDIKLEAVINTFIDSKSFKEDTSY